jgi:hypothetical protein
VTASAAGAPGATFALSVVAAPQVTRFQVNRGQAQRSLVRHLDVTLDSAATASALLGAGRVRLVRRDLNGNSPTTVVLPAGALTVSGPVLTVDFGVNGLGGNRNSNTADGHYTLELDFDGDGVHENSRRFFRLLGDTNGDGKVDSVDLGAINLAILERRYASDADVNGDGVVDATDRLLASRQSLLNRRLGATVRIDG